MTVTDQIKIWNRKIKQNEAQYDLDREAAEISALSSNNLDKCEYLTGEDLDLKPSTVEKAILLNILHWVKFLIKDWRKKIKKKDFLRDYKILKMQI